MALSGTSTDQVRWSESLRKDIKEKVGPLILDYYDQRSKGRIDQFDLCSWGYESPERRGATGDLHNIDVAQYFSDIDWTKGFTGRGADPTYEAMYEPHVLLGPKEETLEEGVNAESPVANGRPESRSVDIVEGDGVAPACQVHHTRPSPEDDQKDNDEDIDPFDKGGQKNQTDPCVRPSRLMQPDLPRLCDRLQFIASQCCQMLERDASTLREMSQQVELGSTAGMMDASAESSREISESQHETSFCHVSSQISVNARSPPEIDPTGGTGIVHHETIKSSKRRREASGAGDIWSTVDGTNGMPKAKRARRNQGLADERMDGSDDDSEMSQQSSKFKLHTIFGPAFFNDTLQGNSVIPNNNEGSEIIVTGIREIVMGEYKSTFGTTLRVEPSPRSWSASEAGMLRTWVQDNGLLNWDLVAWCLCRSVIDCQDKSLGLVMERNRRAGRDLEAGIPGWEDAELKLLQEEIEVRMEAVADAVASAVEVAKAISH